MERATRFVMPVALPERLRRSLTWDQGIQMARHLQFAIAPTVRYFCDPHSPRQRGSNENTDGLLPQYYPKGKADFRTITQADLELSTGSSSLPGDDEHAGEKRTWEDRKLRLRIGTPGLRVGKR